MNLLRNGLSLFALAILGSSAQAQSGQPSPPTAQAPVGSEPGLTTATYGDWTLRCATAQADVAHRVCEVGQTIQVQGQPGPVAQIAFGKPGGGDALRMVAVLPVNVMFPSSVKAFAAEKDAQPLELAWVRCLPGGCFAENGAANDAVRRWRAQPGPGHLTFKEAGGRDVVVPLSLRGLPQALDALAKN